jgi:aspartyl-tRNA(Asn)/glutamyl-tRNA(Gln) amidotransferase subunit A
MSTAPVLEGAAVAPPPDRLRRLVDDPAARAAASATELVELLQARAEAVEADVRAWITPMPEAALADAARIDAARERGERLPLDGLPVALKDNIAVAGVRWTVGSQLFADRVAAEDAVVTRRLRDAGAVILGKATTHELCFGVLGRNGVTGQTHNPWNLGRIPGGSSSGTGAALGADMAVAGLGSDTGGSVRLPAHFNGITGLRPTYGAVSVRGTTPIGPSFDTIGPMARSARDVAALLAVIAGFDPLDPRAVPGEVPDALAGLDGGVAGLRIGVARGFLAEGVDAATTAAITAAAHTLADLGAELVEVDVPGAERAAETITRLVRADALSVHRAAYEATPERFSPAEAARLALGYEVPGVEVAERWHDAHVWRAEVRALFGEVDLVLSATAYTPAPRIGGALLETTLNYTALTLPWALALIPALSFPAGFDGEGMPIGAQLAAPWFRDDRLLRAAAAFQDATDFHARRPGESS